MKDIDCFDLGNYIYELQPKKNVHLPEYSFAVVLHSLMRPSYERLQDNFSSLSCFSKVIWKIALFAWYLMQCPLPDRVRFVFFFFCLTVAEMQSTPFLLQSLKDSNPSLKDFGSKDENVVPC